MGKITIHCREQLDLYHTVSDYIEAHGKESFVLNYDNFVIVIQTGVGYQPMFEAYPLVEEYEIQNLLDEKYSEELEAGELIFEIVELDNYLETYSEYKEVE